MRTLIVFLLLVSACLAQDTRHQFTAGYGCKSDNFVVEAPNHETAHNMNKWAEAYRKSLSLEWFGVELPQWDKPCPITVSFAKNAGGATSYTIDKGEVYGWKMRIQGTQPELTESVLQHEILHTVLVSHFRQALPRWFDEGVAMQAENPSSPGTVPYHQAFIEAFSRRQIFSMGDILLAKEYPTQGVGIFYGQSASMVKFMLLHYPDAEKHVVEFMRLYLMHHSYQRAFQDVYSYKTVEEFEASWRSWVQAGEIEPKSYESAKWIKQCNPDGSCNWIWVPYWTKPPTPGAKVPTIPSQQPISQAPVPDVPPTLPVNPGRNFELEARVQSLENSRDAFGRALQDMSQKNVLVEETIGKYSENLTEIESKVSEQEVVVTEVKEENKSLLKRILGRIKGEKDTTVDEDAEPTEDDSGGTSAWTKAGKIVPVIGAWFGLPGFAIAGLSMVLKFIGRRKEGRSITPFPEGSSSELKQDEQSAEVVEDCEEYEVEEPEVKFPQNPFPPRVESPPTRVRIKPHPQAPQTLPTQTILPTSEGYDPNIPSVETRRVEINSGPQVLVNEVERTTNRYVPVESKDLWKEAYDEAIAKEVELSRGQFASVAQRLESAAAEIIRGRKLADKLSAS